MAEYPTVDYPTLVDGAIEGPVRCESLDGGELYITPKSLKNFKPFEQDGKMWAVTHLQKKSKRGWIKTDPDGYHWWWFWKLQQQDANGNWMPGTERGIYFRKPFSWRFDVAGTLIDGVVRHWIRTKGYLGMHWD